MKPYTVIGYYEDSGQQWAEHYTAADEWDAFAKAAASDPLDVVLVAAVEGHLQVFAPCESGATCFKSDYPTEEGNDAP